MTDINLAPVIYLPHGGGPLPVLGDPSHAPLTQFLKKFPLQLEKPDAIVMVSAHWESDPIAITAGDAPELFFDYYNFPEESYQYRYPAPGNPDLASELAFSLGECGITTALDDKRGFDHGMFIPLMLMYPDANIPCVQVSLHPSLDPELHIRVGESLKAFRERNVMIVGSGLSYHNMQGFGDTSTEMAKVNSEFEQWLMETCVGPDLGWDDRKKRLINWKQAPGSVMCHPREEHLLPVHVCLGASQDNELPGKRVFNDVIMSRQVSGYLW